MFGKTISEEMRSIYHELRKEMNLVEITSKLKQPRKEDIVDFLQFEQFFISEMPIENFKETEGLALRIAVISLLSDFLENIVENLKYTGDYEDYMISPFYELYRFQKAYDKLRAENSQRYDVQQVFLFVDEVRHFLDKIRVIE